MFAALLCFGFWGSGCLGSLPATVHAYVWVRLGASPGRLFNSIAAGDPRQTTEVGPEGMSPGTGKAQTLPRCLWEGL